MDASVAHMKPKTIRHEILVEKKLKGKNNIT